MRSLRIGILAPIKRPITFDTTVSRARVIVDLVQGLVKKGHQVTIFTTADSSLPGAKIVGVVPQGLNFLPAAENLFYRDTAYLTLTVKLFLEKQTDFDIVHNHMYPEFLPMLSLSELKIPMLTTVHSQMTEETRLVLNHFTQASLVAISQSAKKAAGIDLMQVVHNSIDVDFFKPDAQTERKYLLCVGRMSKAKDKDGRFMDPKGISNSIQVAQKLNMPLKIVGNIEDPQFYEQLVKPHLSDKIELVGGVSSEQKLTREEMVKLYQGAIAFINPINWEEPFGLVMAEALACGTPVVAYKRGAVGEIVEHGKTGFVVDPAQGIDGICGHLKQIDTINREICRNEAITHFSTQRMVDEYEKLYLRLVIDGHLA